MIRQVVERIVASKGFVNSPRLAEFLRYVAEETIAGRADDIKEYVIGVAVYKKDPGYNPSTDSTVRTEASRLRSRLQAYYAEDGAAETCRISMPKGGYALRWEDSPPPAEPAAASEPAPAPPATPVPAAPPPASRWLPAWVVPAAIASALTGGLLWWWTAAGPIPVPHLRTRPLTSFPGGEYEPAFSPDGKRIAFTWNGSNQDNFDIYIMGLRDSQPERVTTHAGGELSPVWSPDGKQIAYLRTNDTGLFILDLATRQERKICATKLASALHDRHLDWSPDGKQLALADREADGQPYAIELVDVTDGRRRRITSPSGQTLGDTGPAFSPDGKWLAFRRGTSDAVREILLVPVTGGEPVEVTKDKRHIPAHAWSADGKTLLFVSNRNGAERLWQVEPKAGAIPTGPLTFGQGAYFLAVDRAHGRIAFSQDVQESSIWRLPVKQTDRAQVLISSTRRDASPQYSPDGTKIAFRSDRSGSHEIWLWSGEGNMKALTHFNGPLTGSPRWSPDGGRIVFDSRPYGHSDIYTIPLEGGEPVRVTNHVADDVLPCYSADGRWIFFASNRSGTWQIWKLPVGVEEGSANPPTQVTAEGGFAPQVSPDGEALYCSKYDVPGLWRVAAAGGREQLIVPQNATGRWGWFAPLGKTLLYWAPAGEGGTQLEQLTPGGPVKVLGRIRQRPFPWDTGFSLSPNGEHLIYSVLEREGSDLILAEP